MGIPLAIVAPSRWIFILPPLEELSCVAHPVEDRFLRNSRQIIGTELQTLGPLVFRAALLRFYEFDRLIGFLLQHDERAFGFWHGPEKLIELPLCWCLFRVLECAG
jgi:hypothetical protein